MFGVLMLGQLMKLDLEIEEKRKRIDFLVVMSILAPVMIVMQVTI